MQDLRYALRTLLRAKGFALAVILTLGLGIGANTAIFSVVRGVLLKPLPHREGDRLIYLRQSIDGPGGDNILFSVPEILDFRGSTPSFSGIAEYSQMTYTLADDDDAIRINVGLVTGNYFEVMGLGPVLGRLTNSSDDGTGVPPVMVLTHEFWLRRFGGDSAIIGKQVRLDGRSVTVIGVVEPAPTFPNRMDAILNMVISEHHTSAMMVQGRTHRMTEMIARLTPGATLQQARGEVATIRTRVEAEHRDAYDPGSHHRVALIPFHEVLGERARLTLWLLMGAAAFVMIISCANVVNLTLMRGVRREQELVVRSALGAGSRRLRRLMLVENLVLAIAGAAVGVLIALGGLRMLVALAERYSPRAGEISLDGMVLAFTLGLALLVAVILSYAPPLAKEGSLSGWLTAGANRMSGGLRRQRLQRGLVVAQIAVSVMLLTGAGLLTRTMLRLAEVDSGLTSEQVLTMEVPLGFGRADADAKGLYERMRLELGAIPGVRDVGVGTTMPLRSSQFQLEVKADGWTLAPGAPMPRAEYRTANPDYFTAAGIPLVSGRAFNASDVQETGRVVIINKTLADLFFPGRDAVGERIAWTGDVLRFIGVSGDWRTVVGVVGDTKDGGQDAPARGVVFMPWAQEQYFGSGGLAIRTEGDPTALAGAAMRLVRGIVPNDPIENVLSVGQIRDESVAPRRLNAALVSSFGLLAVIIAAVGIAGVLAFSVSARTAEIGIRMSLGANSGMVQRMVLAEGGVLILLGMVLGILGSILASRMIQGLLFGVAPHDPATLAGVAIVMMAIGVGACWLPALRAARIDPAITIRNQ